MSVKIPNIRAGYFGIGPVLVACLLALALTDILWVPLSRLHEKYPDPVAGAITWSDIDKSVDIHALLLITATTAVLSLAITALARAAVPAGDETGLVTVNQFLFFSLVPAGFRLAVACVSNNKELPPIRFLSLFPLGAVLVLLMLRRYRAQLTNPDIFVIGGAVLLAPMMAAFSAMGVAMAVARLIPGKASKIAPYVSAFTGSAVGAAALALLVIWVVSPNLQPFRLRILRLLMVCQYPVPLLLFYLVPPPLVDASHQFRTPYPSALVATLSILVLIGVYRMFRRFRSATIEADRPLIKSVSPASVVAMMVFVICGSAYLPSASNDFFHFGETMVPWQQLWDYHSIPYVDFAPVHGVMELMNGAFNQMFFDGSAANESAAAVLLAGCSVAFTAITACELLSPLAALLLLFALLPGLDRLYFVAGPLFIIASPRVLRRPVLWLTIWLGVGLFASAYNQAMGPAFVLSTIPVALWQTWRGLRRSPGRLAILIAAAGTTAALVFTIHPAKEIALGFFNFILDNSWTNEAANGIAWAQGAWMRDRLWGIGTSQFSWEFVRFGWISVGIAAAVVCWRQFSRPAADRNLPAIVYCMTIPPTLLISSLWILERMDAGYFSRPGVLTCVTVFYLVPPMVLLTLSKRHPGQTVLLLAAFVGLMYPWTPSGIDPESLLQKPAAVRYIAPGTRMIDGHRLGLPRMGQVIQDNPDWTFNLTNLKNDLARLLKPGETYFDLANTIGLYFYLDMRAAAQYAPYVAANSRLQAVMMHHVEQHPVPVVLIAPTNPYDDVPLSIRCYRPYHDFVLKYSVLNEDGYTFLVEPSRNPDAGPVGSESQLQRLDSIFRREDLLRLPIAWGDSFNAMRNRFASVAAIPAPRTAPAGRNTTPTLTWPIPALVSNGAAADFLRFRFDFVPLDAASSRGARHTDPPPPGGEPQLSLTWSADDGIASAPIRFRGQSGELLIPLGAYPRWLLGHGFRNLTLTLLNPRCAKSIKALDLEFLQLKPL